jgi:hypothetical protein
VTTVTGHLWSDDDDLLVATLKRALRPAASIPESFVAAGKAAFAWRTIDAELAALTYDSAQQSDKPLDPADVDDQLVGASRADSAPLRALTFASAELTIEVEVTHDALFGQLVPPQPGRVDVCVANGAANGVADGEAITDVPIDEVGCFIIRPVPSGSFRLRCHTDPAGPSAGATVLTGWMTP